MNKLLITFLLFITISSVTSSCICTKEYNPVCSKSGKTYSNPCFAKCHNDEIVKRGNCQEVSSKTMLIDQKDENEGCICADIFDPVCAKSGKTYSNQCVAKCHNDEVLEKGECPAMIKKSTEPCFCPAVYDPVCAKSGKTYSNSCSAKCSDDEVLSKGKCSVKKSTESSCICPAVYDPVCAKSGKTFSNECKAKCEGETVFTKGACEKTSKMINNQEQCICPLNYNPVCGKSGKTHSNECFAKCFKDAVVKSGECVVKFVEQQLISKLSKLNDDLTVEYSLENPHEKEMKLLKWGTPLDLQKDMFEIKTPSGKVALYTGIKFKRGEPTLQDYVSLKPKSKNSVVVDLKNFYEIKESGTYEVTLSITEQLEKTSYQKSTLIFKKK